ncbi:glycosyltransferase family 4 protein [Chloroflexota bacterium]
MEPTYKLHVGYHHQELLPYPPQGYEFVVNEGISDGLFKWISRNPLSYKLTSTISQLVPSVLIRAYIGRFINHPPVGTHITFSLNHLIFRKEPWVIEIDATWDPIGPSVKYFKKYRGIMERAFASDYCKRVFCACEFSRQQLISLVDCSGFEQKIDILPRAVHRKEFTKKIGGKKVRLFFLGSANLAGAFEMRGGKEVLEAFIVLNQKYKNLELVIRSDIFPAIREWYKECLKMDNVTLIDSVLPYSELEQIYQSVDIFLIPSHFADWLVMMEAMSYELPVVATNVYAAPEYIDNGKTGFLITPSRGVPYYDDGIPLLNMTSKFQKAIQKVDARVVTDLVDKTSILIENETMRIEMGKAGRWEIEHGRFSIENRNAVFKRVFDEIAPRT